MVRGFVAFLALLLCSIPAMAATPRFTNVLPHGGQRGAECDVVLHGANIDDAKELLIYDKGIEVVSLQVPEDGTKGTQVKVHFKIAPDAKLGSHRMRIRTATGMSDLLNFHVGPLPVVEEVDPNSEFATPQAIANNVTVHGRVDNEDVDYYAIDCKKGERLTAEVYGLRLGYGSSGNFFDPYIAILNSARFELSASDDNALVWSDGVASVVIPEDGKYIVQIRDAAYQGDGRAYYLLSIGNYPRPRAVFPGGGKPGETVKLKFIGDVAGDFEQDVVLPATPAEGDFAVEVKDAIGTAPSGQAFRVTALDNVLEQEPNEATSQITATAATVPAAFNGIIEKPNDQDYFKFTATAGQVFDIELFGRRLRSPIDAVLYVCNKDGNGLVANDDSRGPDSYLRWQCPADGEYSLLVYDQLRGGGPNHAYRIEMTPVIPKAIASMVEFDRYVLPQLVLPQGGGVGVQVTVTRNDFGGPVAFKSDDLPAGVSIECPEVWRGGATMPVVLYAAADAPIAGKFSAIKVHAADPAQPMLNVEGPVMQDVLMILGGNQVRVWQESQIRLPVVVTDPAPFKIRIEPPKVPLVRGGQLNLKVIAERVGDFKAPINVMLLQNPPGLNSAGGVQIPEGQTEALIAMNAAGDAALGDWPISIRAFATVGNGRMDTCSPFVPIKVEEQYVTFEFAQAAVEQGKEAGMLVTVKKRKDWEGDAQVVLYGLPANTTAEPLKLTKDLVEMIFTIKAAENAPAGNNQNLFCQVLFPENGDNVIHNLGTGRLRVDTPPPPKPDAPPMPEPMPMPMPMPEPTPVVAAPPRPLTRLEQLRKDQKEKAEAAKK